MEKSNEDINKLEHLIKVHLVFLLPSISVDGYHQNYVHKGEHTVVRIFDTEGTVLVTYRFRKEFFQKELMDLFDGSKVTEGAD